MPGLIGLESLTDAAKTALGNGGGAQDTNRTAVKTGAYTATPGDLIPVDTTSAAVTVTLPTAPADRSRVAVKLIAGTNPVTIACGGSDVLNKVGGSTSATVSIVNQGVTYLYSAASGIWTGISSDLPLSQLDTRYVTPAAASGTYAQTVQPPTGVAATDTAKVQAAIDAAATAGGGVVRLRAGTYVVNKVTLKTGVTLKGEGRYATVLQLAAGVNDNVIETTNFATLTTTDTSATANSFGVEDLAIDGNKSAQTSGTSHGLAIYGYGYHLDGIIIRNCRSVGLWTEWGSASPFLNPDGMEALITNFKIHNTDGGSIVHQGPHDAQFLNGFVVCNSGYTPGRAAIDIPVDGRANGSVFSMVHVYGGAYDYGVRNTSSGLEFANCQFEGAQVAQALILASINKMSECKWFPGGVNTSTVKGVVIGDGSHTGINNIRLSGKVENCGGGVIDFGSSGGDHFINLLAQYSGTLPGTPVAGTLDSNSVVDVLVINSSGAADATSVFRRPKNIPLTIGRIVALSPTVGTSVVAAAGAGTTPPAPTFVRSANDLRGLVRLGTGTSPAAGSQCSVTYGVAYTGTTPTVVVAPQNAVTAALIPYVTNETLTGFDIAFANAPAASQTGGASGTYSVAYHVLG